MPDGLPSHAYHAVNRAKALTILFVAQHQNAEGCSLPKRTGNAQYLSRNQSGCAVYFFLPRPLPLAGAGLFDTTLVARDVDAEAGEFLALTVSSCLFCGSLVLPVTFQSFYEP